MKEQVDSSSRLVGLMLEPSPDLLVGLVGILKSGHGFVPLDPETPERRAAFVLNDCRVEILVTQEKFLPKALRISEHSASLKHVICLDAITDKDGTAADASVRLYDGRDYLTRDAAVEDGEPDPSGLAYVIYTSGSTGEPKGVPITHANLIPTLLWGRDYFDLGEQTSVLQNLSYWFDFGVWELLTTMLCGGTLHFVARREVSDPAFYARYINEQGVNTLHCTPSFFKEIIAPGGRLDALKVLHLGGEALSPETVALIADVVGPDCALYNGYGPTEASVNCSIYKVGERLSDRPNYEANVPIGRATAHNYLYVLDRYSQPAPVGVPGELYVGGDGLAWGYWNRPSLTASKFVPDPFSGRAGARLYRTGDLVRYRPDGEIEFLGRIDQQVKVRGFRIELGEIEAVLRRHAGVRDAVVLAREDAPGARRLVAYVVPKLESDEAVTAVALRRFLRERLPEYMVPSAFVQLEALPLTPNGKVDRKALPAPDRSARDTEADFVAPRTPAEGVVAGICAEVLGLERIGAHDDLFDLGCHSLLATKILARVREALHADLPLASIFESPTVAGLAARAESAGRAEQEPELPPLEPVERRPHYPLSFVQEGIWFLDQLYSGNTSYFIPRALRIKGELDVPAVAAAFDEIVRHHEILRTVFPSIDGKPVQVILPPAPVEVPLIDLRDIPEGQREERAWQLILEAGRRPFDLERGPLLRVSLLKLGEREHILMLAEHHLVHDGWTQGVLLREFLELYSAISEGRPSPLTAPPIQYVDFAVWQRRWLRGEVLQRQLDYWKRQLAGPPPVLKMETDRPRPPVQSLSGAELTLEIPPELADALRALSRRHGVTLFMTMLAAYQALLHRYTAQEDISVGTPIANRRCQEVEGMLGMIVNMVVIRTDFGGDPTFDELLKRVRKVCLEAYAHQDMPFEMIVQELQPKRDLSYTPFFQTVFGFLDTPMGNIELPGLELELLDAHNRSAKFDLNVILVLHDEQRIGVTSHSDNRGITGLFEYNTDLFDTSTVERLMGHYLQLLQSVVADPARRLSELPILPPDEERRLLHDWNATASGQPHATEGVHEIVARQARLCPDAPAVLWEGRSLTYGELDRRAERLARLLRRRGCRNETVVGVCLERSAAWVVAMLGVLKAGAAYLPLNSGEPNERLRIMLEDSGAKLVLTTGALRERLGVPERDAVYLDEDGSAVALLDDYSSNGGREREDAKPAPYDPRQMAYVIYTSGSTGRPKGVMVEHATLLNLIAFYRNRFGVGAGVRVTQVASPAFDASVFEVWPVLAAGACLCIAGAEERTDAGRMWAWMQKVEAALVYLPTPLAEAVLAEVEAERARPGDAGEDGERGWPTALRTLFTAGDRLRRWNVPGAPFELVNLYGPTEATVASTWTTVGTRAEAFGAAAPSIGQAIDDVQVYVLDAKMHPVPAGVAGELYVGGANVARGYLGRPGLTAERFAPDPFGAEPGGRLYRTGDVVKWNNRGELEFLGRADEQVKVRGYRVELGEIEAALSSHELVSDAVVVALGDEGEPGGRRLVAYVVAGNQRPPAPGALRAYLKEKLPEYMIPHEYVLLDELPLTPNGKIDRRALPTPARSRSATGQDYVPPGTEIEELLAGIWAEVLGLERVGVTDDFFALGGHSLLATQIISRVRDLFKVEVPLQVVFMEPTVAGLGRSVVAALSAARGDAPPSIKRVPRARAMPLSLAQHRLWFINQLDPNSTAYNIPAAVRLSGPLNAQALERAFAGVVRRHESLRTTFKTTEDGPVQIIATEGAPSAMPLTDLRAFEAGRREAEVARLASEEAQRPFDLERGPLLRTALLRTCDEEHVLLLTMHHIVSDGWSMGVLMREVAALYEAFAGGASASPLSELPIQYADFAVWQNEHLRGGELTRQLEYWARQLEGAPPTLELPTDRRRPAVQSFRGASCSLELPAELSESLRALCRREGVTMFMTLLAAFKGLLARDAGRQDIVVGTPVAGRNQTETENIIGFFVNTLILRTDLSGDPSFVELLRRLRGVVLGALAHQDAPFERLVEQLQPERSLSHAPLFQVMFATPTSELPDLESSGLRLQPLRTEAQTSKFDLTLQVETAPAGLRARVEYSTDLFDAETIRRLLGHYEMLLRGIAADPARPLSRLLRLDEDERRQAIAAGRGPVRDYTLTPVQRMFERQAEAAPNSLAVADDGVQLSYGELNARANQLARRLRRMGVGPEVKVGVLLERGVEMVVGWLGVLKAGGAYMPLEPAYPEDRLRFMQHDAGLTVVLTEERLRGLCDEEASAILSLDGEREALDRESCENLPGGAGADNLAFIIYTSGSTGRPKGVELEHGGLSNLMSCVQEDYGLNEKFRTAQVVSSGFDVATWDVWTCLTTGGSLHIVDNLTRTSAPMLLEWLGAKGIEACFLPTVIAEAILAQQSPLPSSLKIMFIGGDRMHRGLERELPFSVFNMYGPSEDTVAVTGAAVPVSPEDGAPPPIGRPLANTEAHVLNERLEPVPDGVPGELYLGGVGLARCYLKRAALTAERFVPHPFSEEPGARLYRTGDVARRLRNGDLDYIGRADRQVKLRGFRIELGEVEAALGGHPSVSGCAVNVGEGRAGQKRLVAHLACAAPHPSVKELRQHLSEMLPEYMIPQDFIMWESLPLTPNGKVDRRALAQREGALPARESVSAPPRTAAEKIVAGIWMEALGVEQLGVDDDFFELGGHSLLASRVILRLREKFRVELPLRSLFETPTISGTIENLSRAWGDRETVEEIAQTLLDVEQLSEEHIALLLSEP